MIKTTLPHVEAPKKNIKPLWKRTATNCALQHTIGYRGNKIDIHRSMRRLTFPLIRWIDVLLIPLTLTTIFCREWPRVATLWRMLISFLSITFDGQITLQAERPLIPILHTALPYVNPNATLPTSHQWLYGMVITLLLLLGPHWLTGKALPVAYGIRFVGIIQASAQLYFFFWPTAFPYATDECIASLTQTSVILILITPWLYTLLYNVLDFGFIRKLLLSSMAMIYLIVLVPLHYVLAATILHQFSLLWCPLFFIIGSIFLQIATLVALYAWAMSWLQCREYQ